MDDDTFTAMAHLRESCAIAASGIGRQDQAQVTCWETDGYAPCLSCGTPRNILADGRKEWVSCLSCETTRVVVTD